MAILDELVTVGVYFNQNYDLSEFEPVGDFYHLNIWNSTKPAEPTIIPVPYRGGYSGGFNDLFVEKDRLFVADGEGIQIYDLDDISKNYVEIKCVDEVSDMFCRTSGYLVSSFGNVDFQIRSLDKIFRKLCELNLPQGSIDVPYQKHEYDWKSGNTILSMFPIGHEGKDKIILNNADDKTYLFNLESIELEEVNDNTNVEFPNTFQRREKHHFFLTDQDEYLVFTESTSDDPIPNRVYSFNTRGPPIIKELEPYALTDKQILSMYPTRDNQLEMLVNYKNESLIEKVDPYERKIVDSKGLKRKYGLGDRLQRVQDQLLIVRHVRDEIVDVETEDYFKLSGAENNVAIPEISSSWKYPQFLYVVGHP